MERPGKDSDAQLLLRLPSAMKTALQREAAIQGRTMTAEINLRLQASFQSPLPPSYTAPNHLTVHSTESTGAAPALRAQEKSPADSLSEIDRAMLGVLRRMPVEKQLALLSLFK